MENNQKDASFFVCPGEPEDIIANDFRDKIGVRYTRHFCQLPVCTTVEACQLGAGRDSSVRDNTFIKEFRYKSLDEITSLKYYNLKEAPVADVIDRIKLLSEEGRRIILNIEGPFSILSQFVSSEHLYRAMYKSRGKLLELCLDVIGFLGEYVREAYEAGIDVISYADPAISYEVTSVASYKRICGEVTCIALKMIQEAAPNTLIHVCSATSVNLEKAGCAVHEAYEVSGKVSYGEAILEAALAKQSIIIGHGCLMNIEDALAEARIYELKIQ